jgi:hypothetical protein
MKLPQTPLELVSSQIEWAKANINNNLDFLPADKLDWKPAPASKSALEIINHATETVNMFTSAIQGTENKLTPATDLESAKALIIQVVTAHQAVLSSLKPEDLERVLKLPIGDMPVGAVASLPTVELINHHGQITYIQSLLGDSESHLIFQ